ncbi:MAG TPA: hypothetical protein PLJ27_12705 [Polyangiaceae bacterium]|jgi:hypothetical protein|nr:MAG: hypothetical protein BWY17_04414 [Deltaproteobacteria bacterium ADurb.Bin207]HNS97285.1 hypothetical protein [Polyangiaceae bacterium]HNZ25359.1 hypothetical protein [Polyangiaceae bacterium]HOD24274.1 hypothetical protein [Polyangiaceae bacterium]HOE50795.1 hypothetical protein [Polyangiaceae bacterium]
MSNIKRTQFAQAAFDYATYFTATFGRTQIGGGCIRRPHLVAPDGMSTAGGKLIRQHIVLRPDVPAFSTLTVGAVDVAKGAATLRTFGYLRHAHQARFGSRPFDLDGVGYQTFFSQAQEFFARQGMRVDVETEANVPKSDVPTAPPDRAKTTILVVITLVVLVILSAVAVGGYVLIRILG